jgi:hypothetical protein
MNDRGFATMDVMGGFQAIWYKSCFLGKQAEALFIAQDQV